MSSVQSSGKKIGINTVVSWGASVVIIGLMFKILHLKGGEYMIGIGLAAEAVLFFILGFAAMSEPAPDVPVAPVVAEPARVVKEDPRIKELIETYAVTIGSLNDGFAQFRNMVGSQMTAMQDAKVVNAEVDKLKVVVDDMKAKVEKATVQIDTLGKNLSELNVVYRAQLDAFRKTN